MKSSHRLAKNTASGLVAAVLGGVGQFVSIFIVAHYLGVKEFGIFNYILAFATVFQFVADFGLSNILVREMARNLGDLDRLLGASKGLLTVLFFVAAVLMLLVVGALHVDPRTKELSLIMSFGYLLLLPSVSYVAVLRATEDMEYNALGFILQRVLLVFFLWIALTMGWGLWGVVCCHFLANSLQWAFYHWVVTHRYAGVGRMRWDLPLWKSLIVETLPLGGGMVLRQLAWQLDIFMLTYFATPTAVGLFGGPFRLVTGLTLLAAVLTVPLFPMFVRLARDSREELGVVYRRAVKWFCIISCPIMAACVASPFAWIHLFMGEHFYAAAPVLRMLGVAIVPVFISILYPFLYSALHIQKWFLAAMAAVVVARLGLGCWIIPRYGYLGECVLIVALELALFFTLAFHLSRIGLSADLKNTLLKPVLASGAMGLLLYVLGNDSVLITTAVAMVGGVLYLGMLVLLGVFTSEEWQIARRAYGFAKSFWMNWRVRGTVQT